MRAEPPLQVRLLLQMLLEPSSVLVVNMPAAWLSQRK